MLGRGDCIEREKEKIDDLLTSLTPFRPIPL
jgi:hypothetical protein